MKRTEHICCRTTPALKELLKEASKAERRTPSNAITIAVEDWARRTIKKKSKQERG